MNKIVEIEIGIAIDQKGNADKFDPDSDTEKTLTPKGI
jgi:hypothetical protein